MSMFGDLFGAAPMLKLLDVHGDTVSYKNVAGTVTSLTAIYNELVGAMDDFGNAIFTLSTDPTIGVASPSRGDEITFAGDKWTVVDVRDDNAGMAELRCVRGVAVS